MNKDKKLKELEGYLLDAKYMKKFYIVVGVGIILFSLASGALLGYIIESMAKSMMIFGALGAIGFTYAGAEIYKANDKIEEISNQIRFVKEEKQDYVPREKLSYNHEYANVNEDKKRFDKAIKDEQEFEKKFSYKPKENETHDYGSNRTNAPRR